MLFALAQVQYQYLSSFFLSYLHLVLPQDTFSCIQIVLSLYPNISVNLDYQNAADPIVSGYQSIPRKHPGKQLSIRTNSTPPDNKNVVTSTIAFVVILNPSKVC